MVVQANRKVKIPDEKETRIKILSTARLIGCYNEAKNIIDKIDGQWKKETSPNAIKQMAQEAVVSLFKLDVRLVSFLINENGEIVVGGEVVIKIVDWDPEKGTMTANIINLN